MNSRSVHLVRVVQEKPRKLLSKVCADSAVFALTTSNCYLLLVYFSK